MGTFDRLASTSALLWLRDQVDRLRRALPARRPAVRWGLILAVVLGLGGGGYWTAISLVPVGYRPLDAGRSFSSQDLLRITRALHAQAIEYHVNQQKVEVPADQYEQAMAAYAKLDVGPRPLEELREPSDSWGLLDTPDDREWKRRLVRERMLGELINQLDGVAWSLVSIQYPRAKGVGRSRAKPSAFVYLETKEHRRLPSRTVESIPTILVGYEPELSREAITLVDAEGHQYLDPGNPAVGDHSRDQVREEEIRERILEKLAWIGGVQVFVKLCERREAAAPRPGPSPADPPPAIVVNRPFQLDEPGPASSPPAAPADQPGTQPGGDRMGRGRVLVHVPRSFYFKAILTGAERREPTNDELRGAAARIKEQILRAVGLVVPDSWQVEVDTIYDDGPVGRLATLSSGADSRRKVMDWGIVAAVAAAVAVVTALGSWIQVARRPARPTESARATRRYRVDAGAEPSPSERVRELVRRDPEAAAGVLQRWAAPGGRAS